MYRWCLVFRLFLVLLLGIFVLVVVVFIFVVDRLLLFIWMLLLTPNFVWRDMNIFRESRLSFSFNLLIYLSKDLIVFTTVSLILPLIFLSFLWLSVVFSFLCVLCLNADFVISSCDVIMLVELYGHLHIDVMSFDPFIIIMSRCGFCFCANCDDKFCAFGLSCTLLCLQFSCCRLVLVLSLLSI
jgi:hypothetical protein